jgi:F-type H+-transporting ATPase subunit a
MTTRQKAWLALGLYVLTIVVFVAVFGFSRAEDVDFQPHSEFKLETWIDGPGPFDIDKAAFYVVLAGVLTVGTMLYFANRMQVRPNRTQVLVEMAYTFMRDYITRSNMSPEMAAKWFPFIATLFLFIWFSNIVGFLPLPTNTLHPVEIGGLEIPAFALYAATGNLSIPLVLALITFFAYNIQGIRAKGFFGYLKSLVPSGITGPIAGFLFVLELFSNVMRIVSLSVRLFANILAGHLIILFMSGALAILLGVEALGIITLPLGVVLFLFEVGLVATLQAFIFSTLTAIYLGGATAESH